MAGPDHWMALGSHALVIWREFALLVVGRDHSPACLTTIHDAGHEPHWLRLCSLTLASHKPGIRQSQPQASIFMGRRQETSQHDLAIDQSRITMARTIGHLPHPHTHAPHLTFPALPHLMPHLLSSLPGTSPSDFAPRSWAASLPRTATSWTLTPKEEGPCPGSQGTGGAPPQGLHCSVSTSSPGDGRHQILDALIKRRREPPRREHGRKSAVMFGSGLHQTTMHGSQVLGGESRPTAWASTSAQASRAQRRQGEMVP